jgi:hypothetical protein
MDVLRVLEIVSLLTTIVGLYLLGEKIAIAFYVYNVSLACQAYIFYKNRNWFLIFQMGVLMAFNFYNYFKWTGAII